MKRIFSLITFLIFGLYHGISQKSIVYDLQVDGLYSPIGIDSETPTFSWKIDSEEYDVIQKHYQIFVATDAVFSEKSLVWDSGKVNSSESVYINFQGQTLEYATKYYWAVKVWTNKSSKPKQSKISSWTTGLMVGNQWKSEWIGVNNKDNRVSKTPYFTNDFVAGVKIKSANLFITSRGIYEAHINGKRVGNSYLTPGWTSYNNRIQYQAYDVQNMLCLGDNRLGVILSDGWFRNFRPNNGKTKTDYGDELSFIAELVITFEDGVKKTIINDNNWNYHFGSIQSSSIYNGEIADFNLNDPNWSKSKNKNPNSKKARFVKRYDGKLDHTRNEMIKKREVLDAKELIITPSGDKVLDFGQNLVGWVQFKSNLPKGTVVTLYHAEVLDKAGEFYTTNLRKAKQKNIFTLNGKTDQIYHPTFTFQGFRYLKVEGVDQINLDDFKAVALYSDMEFTGSLTTSNELINQLQENIQWGQRGNFLDVPTDCPQRDERLGWTGDAQAFFNTAGFNMDVKNFFDKWLIDLSYDQRSDGAVPGVVPHNNYLGLNDSKELKGNFGRTGWADAATIIPWHSYLIYGDKQTLERQYQSMVKWIDFMTQNSKNHLYIKEDHWGDWLFFSRDDDNSGRSAVTSKKLIAQAFYCYSTKLLIKSATALGYVEDANKYSKLYAKLVNAFNNEFVTKNGMLVSDSQTAYVLALKFNLLSKENIKVATERLVNNINDYGHLTTGFLGTPFLCHVLSDNGKNKEAIKLLLREEYPSWLYPVTKGATTIWERWNGIKPDGSFQYPSMNSFNHYAYGAIGEWMYNNLMGLKINQDFPGYKRFTIQPLFDENFDNISGTYNSNYGNIKVNWSRKNDNVLINISIPPNSQSDVFLSKPHKGNWTFNNMKAEGSVLEKKDDTDKTYFLLGSGDYQLRLKTE